MKRTMRNLLSLLLVVFLAAGLFADTKEIKGKDFVIKIEGGKIVFVLERDGQKAAVPGYFNGWKPTADEAQMEKKDGKFVFSIDIEKFAASKPYEFKFYVDGNWDPDPNQSLNLAKKGGEWVFAVSPTEKVKANSALSPSIMFSGRYTTWFPFQMNVKNTEWNPTGDDGMYITDSMHNFDLDMNYKIGDMVLGFARLKMNYQQSGDRGLYLDSLSTDFMRDDVKIMAFYRKRNAVLGFDNPGEVLRKFVNTAYDGISFYKEKNDHDLYDFGRHFAGAAMFVDSIFNLQFLIGRYVGADHAIRQNDLIAARMKPVSTKTMHVGLFWVYNANQDPWESPWLALQNGARYVDYLRSNPCIGYYNHTLGLDFVLGFGNLTLFAEGSLLRTQGTAGVALSSGNEAINNIVALGGAKLKAGNLLIQALGQYYLMDVGDNTLVVSAKGKLTFGKKNYIAVAFDMMMPDGGDALWGQRADGRLETDFFDLWAMESFKTLSSAGSTYTRFEATAGLDWYINSKLVLLVGVKFVSDANAIGFRTSFTAITPLLGVKYSFAKDISFSLFFGRELGYDSYLEDNGRTLQYADGWTATGSSPSKEQQMAGMHRITLKAEMSF